MNEIIDRSADILTSLEQTFFSIFIESFIYVRLYHKNKISAGVEMYASDYRNLIGECSNRVEYIPERSSSGLNRLRQHQNDPSSTACQSMDFSSRLTLNFILCLYQISCCSCE